MTWQAFLEHPSVIHFQKNDNAERYLYFKTLHEILVGTTNYIGGIFVLVGVFGKFELDERWKEIIENWEYLEFRFPVSPKIKACLQKWNPSIQLWRESLLHLQNLYHYSDPGETSTLEWQKLIQDIGDVVQDIEKLVIESNSLILPTDSSRNKFVKMIQSSGIERIYLIYQLIRLQDYIRIWNYPALDESE